MCKFAFFLFFSDVGCWCDINISARICDIYNIDYTIYKTLIYLIL